MRLTSIFRPELPLRPGGVLEQGGSEGEDTCPAGSGRSGRGVTGSTNPVTAKKAPHSYRGAIAFVSAVVA